MSSELSIYRICPECKKDILKHYCGLSKEGIIFYCHSNIGEIKLTPVAEYIKEHGEEIKQEIEQVKLLNKNTPDQVKEYILNEIGKFQKLILDNQRNLRNPLNPKYKSQLVNLHDWDNIIEIYQAEINKPKQYADKWYAYLLRIKISIGKELPSLDSKKSIIKYGKEHNAKGIGFYIHFINTKINDIKDGTVQKRLPKKEKGKFHDIINEISGYDSDISFWLKNIPK